MSTPGFPRHPESVPPRIAYTPGHRQWLDENRGKRHRMTALKVLAIPSVVAVVVICTLAGITPPQATLMFTLKTNIVGASIVSCVLFGFYVDFWTTRTKTRGDRIYIRILGVASGALIGLTGFLISLIPA